MNPQKARVRKRRENDMAYIDVDKAIESIGNGDGTSMQKLFAECCVLAVPTADVVPRTVIAEIFAEFGKFGCTNEHDYEEFCELKKKYGVD